jgi:DNA invertase Pin-like site-specific DNA recombinase
LRPTRAKQGKEKGRENPKANPAAEALGFVPHPNLRGLRGLERIEQAGASFQSLTEHVETRSPAGRMLMQMLGSFAEFERAMIRERTRQGLEYAKSKGITGGRRFKLTPDQAELIVRLVDSGERKAADLARSFQVSEATVSRLIARHRQKALASKKE